MATTLPPADSRLLPMGCFGLSRRRTRSQEHTRSAGSQEQLRRLSSSASKLWVGKVASITCNPRPMSRQQSPRHLPFGSTEIYRRLHNVRRALAGNCEDAVDVLRFADAGRRVHSSPIAAEISLSITAKQAWDRKDGAMCRIGEDSPSCPFCGNCTSWHQGPFHSYLPASAPRRRWPFPILTGCATRIARTIRARASPRRAHC